MRSRRSRGSATPASSGTSGCPQPCRVPEGAQRLRGVEAEGEGVEPSVRLPAQRFSRPPDSTTLAPLRERGKGSNLARVDRMDDATLARFADLVIGFGANVQSDQIVAIGCEPGKEYLVRALAASAYRHGAKFVDVGWFDPHVKRARIEHADPGTLDFVPPWYGQRVLALGDARAARVALSGPTAPGLMADLDPVLVGRDRLPTVKES